MSNPRRSQGPSGPSTPSSITHADDPEGEEAYHRAFSAAAKMDPPRIPNPIAYPKSPSAQAYLRSRSARQYEPSNKRVDNPTYVEPPEDVHSKRRASRRQQMDTDHPESSTRRNNSNSTSPQIKQDPYNDSRGQIRAPPQPQHQYEHRHQSQGLPYMPSHQQKEPRYGYDADQDQRPPADLYFGGHTMEPQLQAPSGPRNPFERR